MPKFFGLLLAAAVFSIPTIGNATSIPSGNYVANFGGGECGVLVSTPTALKYTYGPCGKAPTYTASSVKRRGNNVSIDSAKFDDFTIDGQGNLRGTWSLGDYKAIKFFKLQK